MSFHNTSNVSKKFKSPMRIKSKSGPSLDIEIDEYESLKKKEESLDHDVSLLIGSQTDVKTVMNLLHQLNEIKDATQIVLGRLAALEGQTFKQMHERFGLETKD